MFFAISNRPSLAGYILCLLANTLPLLSQADAEDVPIKHRLVLAEYGMGPNRLLELDAEGRLVWEYAPPSTTVIFEVQPSGNILFGYGGKPTGVLEITSRGAEVFDYVSKSAQVFGCSRLPNGNTLISCGTQKRVIEVTPDKRIVWEFGASDAPELNITWVSSIQQLKNGNLIVGNFLRGQEGKGAHAFEVTRDKNVVWKWEDHSLIKSLTKMRTGPVFCEMLAGRSRQHSGCYRATHRE